MKIASISFLAGLVSLLTPASLIAENDRPNIVFILTDNQGAWHLGCYGNPDFQTPNIDQLASEGVRFSRAFANNAVCSPTRATFLTGLTPSQHGVHRYLSAGKAQMGPEAYYTLEEYATQQLDLPKSTIFTGMLWAAGAHLIAIPFFGALSDKVGRRPVYMAGAIAMLFYPFLFFMLMDTKSPPLIWLAIILSLIIHAAMYGPQAAFFSELFGTKVRYSGASLGYQLASPFAGGLAPLIAGILLTWSMGENTEWSKGVAWPIAAYISLTAVITLVSVWFTEETYKSDLDH